MDEKLTASTNKHKLYSVATNITTGMPTAQNSYPNNVLLFKPGSKWTID